MKDLKQIFLLFAFIKKKRKFQFFFIIGLIVFTAFFEMATLGSVVPFLSSLLNPNIEPSALTTLIEIPDFMDEELHLYLLFFFYFSNFIY